MDIDDARQLGISGLPLALPAACRWWGCNGGAACVGAGSWACWLLAALAAGALYAAMVLVDALNSLDAIED